MSIRFSSNKANMARFDFMMKCWYQETCVSQCHLLKSNKKSNYLPNNICVRCGHQIKSKIFFELTKQSVPYDKSSGIILVNTIPISTMMYSVMTRSVKYIF